MWLLPSVVASVMEIVGLPVGKVYSGDTVSWYRFARSIDEGFVDVLIYGPTCPFLHSGSVLINASSSDD